MLERIESYVWLCALFLFYIDNSVMLDIYKVRDKVHKGDGYLGFPLYAKMPKSLIFNDYKAEFQWPIIHTFYLKR